MKAAETGVSEHVPADKYRRPTAGEDKFRPAEDVERVATGIPAEQLNTSDAVICSLARTTGATAISRQDWGRGGNNSQAARPGQTCGVTETNTSGGPGCTDAGATTISTVEAIRPSIAQGITAAALMI